MGPRLGVLCLALAGCARPPPDGPPPPLTAAELQLIVAAALADASDHPDHLPDRALLGDPPFLVSAELDTPEATLPAEARGWKIRPRASIAAQAASSHRNLHYVVVSSVTLRTATTAAVELNVGSARAEKGPPVARGCSADLRFEKDFWGTWVFVRRGDTRCP